MNSHQLLGDFENWMTLLPMTIKTQPIINLAIPGTHDSMTFAITRKSGLAPDAEPILKLLRFLGPILRLIMSRWSRTQEFSVTEQLKNGIRYFDLRLASKIGSDDLFFVHGLYSCAVKAVLNEIKDFLDEHPKEVVFLDCQHFYQFSRSNHKMLMEYLLDTFHQKLVPYSHYLQTVTLSNLESRNLQVFVIYRSDEARYGQPFFWPSASFPSPWPNTVSPDTLFRKLDESLKKRSHNAGFVSQCVLTPTPLYVTKHLLSSLKSRCVVPIKEMKYEWIRRQQLGRNGINIVISDFVDVDGFKFCGEVIGLNYTHYMQVSKQQMTAAAENNYEFSEKQSVVMCGSHLTPVG